MSEERNRPWSEREVTVAVVEYLAMLALQQRGVPFNKRARVEAIIGSDLSARSRKSVEFKYCNISAALAERGHETLRGYAPLPHRQALVDEVISRLLT